MKTLQGLLSALCLGLFVIVLSSCEEEGPAERAGKQVDQAIEEAGDTMEKVGDKLEEATDQ